LDTDLLGEAGEAAAKAASKVGSKVAGIADEAAGAVESRVAGAAESRAASVAESRAASARTSSMPKTFGANTGTVASTPGGLSATAQASFLDESAAAGGVDARPVPIPDGPTAASTPGASILSDGVKAANEKAANALETTKKAVVDAGKKELGKAKTEASSAFKKRLRESAGALGLGVVGSRGEQLASTYEDEFEADDDNKPRQTTDSPGLLQTDADLRQLRGMFGHMGSQPTTHQFGNPWYS
jgi:hypothetical protein